MKRGQELKPPVGRFVLGSFYVPQTTDAEGNALVIKTGAKAGQPTQRFFFALAIAKKGEAHWNQTDWGKLIWTTGQLGFPQGQANSPTFAWKIIDGDSNIPNKAGNPPNQKEGYPGHWILNFSSTFAPKLYNHDGSVQLVEVDEINLGDYIEVYGSVSDNESMQQPGVYLNPTYVARAGYGERIFGGADPKAVGFGQGTLPNGASTTPVSSGFNPGQTTLSPPVAGYTPPPVASAPPPVTPHTAILTPPAPVAPARIMLPAADGHSYEAYIAQGWTDADLIAHGKMAP